MKTAEAERDKANFIVSTALTVPHVELIQRLDTALRERDQARADRDDAQLRLKQGIAGLTWLGENEAMNATGLAEQLIAAESKLASALSSLTTCKDKAILAIPAAVGFTADDLQEIADVAKAALASLTSETQPKPKD